MYSEALKLNVATCVTVLIESEGEETGDGVGVAVGADVGGTHEEAEVAPGAELVPDGQGVQVVEPAAAYVSALQVVQVAFDVAPAALLAVPAGQSRQLPT